MERTGDVVWQKFRSDSAGVQAISTEKPRSLSEKIQIINKEQFLFFTPWKYPFI